MTKDEALLMALATLEEGNFVYPTALRTAIIEALAQPSDSVEQDIDYWIKQHTEARQAELGLRRELESLKAEQEPVGVIQHLDELNEQWTKHLPIGTKLYTTPPKREPDDFDSWYASPYAKVLMKSLEEDYQPKREWVGLTDDEIFKTHKQVDSMQYLTFGKAIEAKLKEKNA